MTWTRVCSSGDLAENTALHVDAEGVSLCLARSNGIVAALHDVCSHAEVALSEGEVSDGTVECWLHGSRFDLATGEPLSLPANLPVRVYTTKEEAGDVWVAVDHT